MARVVRSKALEEDEFRRIVGLIPNYFYLNDSGETVHSYRGSGAIHPLLASYCQANPEISDFEIRESVKFSINHCLKSEKFDLSFFLDVLNEDIVSKISLPKAPYRAFCKINSCREDLASKDVYRIKFDGFDASLCKNLSKNLSKLDFYQYRENFLYDEVNSGGFVIISGNFRSFISAGDKLTKSADALSSYINFVGMRDVYSDYRWPQRQKAALKFGPNWYVYDCENRKFSENLWINATFQPEFWALGPVGWNEIELMMARVKSLLKCISGHFVEKRINAAILNLGESWRAVSTQDRAISIWKSFEALLAKKSDTFETIYKRASKIVFYDEKFKNELKFVSQWRNHSVHAHAEKPYSEHVERIFESVTHSLFFIIDTIIYLKKIRDESEYFYFLDINMNENEINKVIRLNMIAYNFIRNR